MQDVTNAGQMHSSVMSVGFNRQVDRCGHVQTCDCTGSEGWIGWANCAGESAGQLGVLSWTWPRKRTTTLCEINHFHVLKAVVLWSMTWVAQVKIFFKTLFSFQVFFRQCFYLDLSSVDSYLALPPCLSSLLTLSFRPTSFLYPSLSLSQSPPSLVFLTSSFFFSPIRS